MVYWNITMKLCNQISVLLWSQYVTNIENTFDLICNLFGIYQNKNKDVITAWSFIYILWKTLLLKQKFNWWNIYLIIIAWSCKHVIYEKYEKSAFNDLIMSTCFTKKPCIRKIRVWVETELCKKRVIYLSKGCTIYLEFICHSFVLRWG